MKSLTLALTLIALGGCASYPSITKVGKGTVAVVKNHAAPMNWFVGPQIYICQATTNGLKNCRSDENP